MDTHTQPGMFRNISQRIASSYYNQLALYNFSPQVDYDQGAINDAEKSFQDLYEFFKSFYNKLYFNPELFGLPVADDVCILGDGTESQDQKQEINRKLQKPREIINMALEFLMFVGTEGNVEGQGLRIQQEALHEVMEKPKVLKKILEGFEKAGLKLSDSEKSIILTNTLFPAMMPALKTFATHCAQYPDKPLGKFHFARCDFKVLQKQYDLDVAEIYRVFSPDYLVRIQHLHKFFTDRGYKPLLQLGGVSGWVVKYQGKRQIKASPLFEVSYQERRKDPLEVFIKCASANRIIPLIEKQTKELQDDFYKRVYQCRGKDCGWCKNRKGLGPTVYHHHNGERLTACWYTNPDILNFNDEVVELIKQYAIMHEQLA